MKISNSAPPPPASPPAPCTPAGAWIRVVLTLADGATLELCVGGVVAGIAATHAPDPGERPSVAVIRDGQRRRGHLTQLLGGDAP